MHTFTNANNIYITLQAQDMRNATKAILLRPSGLLNQEVCMAENLDNYFEQNRVMFI